MRGSASPFLRGWCYVLLLLLSGCRSGEVLPQAKPELLIYCGITMTEAVREVANVFEGRHRCTIKISKGGSGELLRSLESNQVGDLFLPGEESFMEAAVSRGLVTQEQRVGSNRVTLMTAKDNPLAITPVLESLLDPRYRVVLGESDSGSVGRESRRVLERTGIYQQVQARAIFLTTDSKGLVQAIRDGQADLALNWHGSALDPEHAPHVSSLPLPEDAVSPHFLQMGLLRFSSRPELARRFMAMAASEEGQAIFARHGFAAVHP